MLVTCVSQQGRHLKLMNTWAGLWYVVNNDKKHVYTVQNITNSETRGVHIARMKQYFQHIDQRGEYRVVGRIKDVRKAKTRHECVTLVLYEELRDVESTCQLISWVFTDSLVMILEEELEQI